MELQLQQHLSPVVLPALPFKPLVSLLISNYNYAHFAPEAIESALGQTYRHTEIIVCDDGSSDNSLEVFSSYERQDSRIKVIAKENGGHATGLNAAYRACQGDIICMLDTDDVCMPDKIERVVRKFEQFPAAGCVIHRLLRVDAQRRPRGIQPLFAHLPEGWYGAELLTNGGVLAYMPGTAGLNFRRQITERMFPLPPGPPLNICPDMVMMRLAPFLTEIRAISAPLAEVRQHSRNTYARKRLTAESIKQELNICEHLWKEQHGLLERISPEIAMQFQPQEVSTTIMMQRYVLAKLSGDSAAPDLARKLVGAQENRYKRWLWRAAAYLPKPLFTVAINHLTGHTRWKQFLGNIHFFLKGRQKQH